MAATGQTAAELKEILQRVAVPCYILDDHGRFTWLNDAAIAEFGDATGRHFSELLPPAEVPRVERQFTRKLDGEPVTDYETEVFTADGRRVDVEISSVAIPHGDSCHAVFGIADTLPVRRRNGTARLTRRQADVLWLLANGQSTNQIAKELHLSRETVRNYIRQLLRALGAHSRIEAVAVARRERLLDG